jgi:hypothetical protein
MTKLLGIFILINIFILSSFLFVSNAFASTKSLSQSCTVESEQVNFEVEVKKNCELNKFDQTLGELRNVYFRIKSEATFAQKVQNLSKSNIYFSSDLTTTISTNNFATNSIKNEIPFGTALELKPFSGSNNFQNKDSGVFPISTYSDIDSEIIDDLNNLQILSDTSENAKLNLQLTIKTSSQFTPVSSIRVENNVKTKTEIELVYNYFSQDLAIGLSTSSDIFDYTKPNLILNIYNADSETTSGNIKINIPKNSSFEIKSVQNKDWQISSFEELFVIETSSSLSPGRNLVPLNIEINQDEPTINFEASLISDLRDGNLSNNRIKIDINPSTKNLIQIPKTIINSKAVSIDPQVLIPSDFKSNLKITGSEDTILIGIENENWFDLEHKDYEVVTEKSFLLKAKDKFVGRSSFDFEYLSVDNKIEKSKFVLVFDESGVDIITLSDVQSIELPRTGGFGHNYIFAMLFIIVSLLSLKISFLEKGEFE